MGNKEHIEGTGDLLKDKILNRSAQLAVPQRIGKVEAWEKIEKRLTTITMSGKQVRLEWGHFFKIAASLLIVALAAYVVYHQQEVELFTSRGEHRLITLPDHSTVLLNAESSLHYNSLLFSFTRKVYFGGEGFFSVQKGSRFDVVSENGTVRVLGTQFNVVTRDNTYEVSCVEGKVSVQNRRASKVVLTAGLRTFLSNNNLQQPAPVGPEVTSWTNGEFYFDNAPLSQVVNTLSLQYNITVRLENVDVRYYTGYFTKYDLEEALKLVCAPLALNFEILNTSEVKISTKK